MKTQRWQGSINLALGAWLFLSPFLGIGETNDLAAWSSYICGITVTLVASLVLSGERMWEEPINLLIAFWLVLAPFVLKFPAGPTWNHVVVGIIVGGGAMRALLAERPCHYRKGYR